MKGSGIIALLGKLTLPSSSGEAPTNPLSLSPVRVRVWLTELPARKIAPPHPLLRLRFGLGFVLGMGALFLGGNCPRTHENMRKSFITLNESKLVKQCL